MRVAAFRGSRPVRRKRPPASHANSTPLRCVKKPTPCIPPCCTFGRSHDSLVEQGAVPTEVSPEGGPLLEPVTDGVSWLEAARQPRPCKFSSTTGRRRTSNHDYQHNYESARPIVPQRLRRRRRLEERDRLGHQFLLSDRHAQLRCRRRRQPALEEHTELWLG